MRDAAGMRCWDFSLRALLLLLAFGWPSLLTAEVSSSAFEAANKLYYEGKFAEAAPAYEKLVQAAPASAALYFNLGNAWFKAGQIGRAIVAYRKAERLTPRDPDIRANLQFARNQVQGPSLVPKRWQRGLDRLTLNEWTLLAAGALWIWLIALAIFQWRPAWRRNFRTLLLGLTVATVLLSACLAAAIDQQRSVQTAVLVAPETMVRNGPLEESKNLFAIHDGAELRVLERKDDWLLVAIDARRTGWLRREQVLPAAN